MSDYTAKDIDEMEAAYGGGFVKVRAELGVTAFGLQVIRLPPNADQYPEHDHVAEGQEEVFVPLRGSGWMDVDGEKVDLDPNTFVRVGPGARRKIYSGPEGLSVLAMGGVPGEPYTVKASSELEGS
jgi:mannose-6-phosphate isomerase-like protein (cupin superfamily)